jgi:hypothetical protein
MCNCDIKAYWRLNGRTRPNSIYSFAAASRRVALERYRVAGSSLLSFVEDCCVVAEGRRWRRQISRKRFEDRA